MPTEDILVPQQSAILAALGRRSLVLVGMPAAGKSSLGRRLAQRLGTSFVDCDAEVEAAAGMTVAEIYGTYGEPDFRSGESRVATRLLENGPQVLALGEGGFMDADLRLAIRSKGVSIWLKADLDVLLRRVKRRKLEDRPILRGDPVVRLKELMADRHPIYAEADVTVASRDVAHEVIVDDIVAEVSAALLPSGRNTENDVSKVDADIDAGSKKRIPSKERIGKAIESAAEKAPQFRAYRGRIRYRQTSATTKSIAERKAVARECCNELQALCAIRANEQPRLKELSDRYATALVRLRKDKGAYRLFMVGLQIEGLLRIAATAPPDAERNPPIDADLLSRAESLIIAHAGLITLFPDINTLPEELDRYRAQSESVDALRNRILDPVLDQLIASREILDAETQEITHEMLSLDQESEANVPPTRAAISTKHAWLRGVLPAMARHLLHFTKDATRLVKNADRLASAIIELFGAMKTALLRIADTLNLTFGWIRWLLSYLGLV